MPGRRERRKLEQHESLLNAATALFVEHGFDATTYDHIAERADVARGTVFNYFPRKELFIEAYFDRRRQELAALAEQGIDGADALQVLRDIFQLWARLYEKDAKVSRVMVCLWADLGRRGASQGTPDLFASVVATGQQQGQLRGGLDPAAIGNALFDIGGGVLLRWARAPRMRADPKLGEQLDRALDLLIDGIRAG